MPRPAQEPNDGNGSDKAENRRRGDIALQRKAFQEWRLIGDYQPCGENQRQTDANVNTGARRRVAANVEPTIPGQMRSYQHRYWAPNMRALVLPSFTSV